MSKPDYDTLYLEINGEEIETVRFWTERQKENAKDTLKEKYNLVAGEDWIIFTKEKSKLNSFPIDKFNKPTKSCKQKQLPKKSPQKLKNGLQQSQTKD